ncbi:hypothetical protein SAMN02910409_0576 [Prevotellaceae bacterium HUN156]|nr:hypothetical protein SAMN02910409_0576 [Prevotellaceae bacterium HUN156]
MLAFVVSVVCSANSPVVIPEGLNTETYGFKATVLMNGDTKTSDFDTQLEVGFDGDDIYIQGFSIDTPEFWVKGSKNADGNYVIPSNQYMGTWDVGGIGWYVMDYYFTAVDEQSQLADVVFTVDTENKTISNNQTLVVNGAENEVYPYYTLTDGIFHFIPEVAAMPANPSVVDFVTTGDYPWVAFNIPTVGTNGEELLMKRLSYQIWVEKEGELSALTLTKNLYDYLTEDMSVIPYSFSDMTDILRGGEKVYLFQGKELKTWNNIGVKCIYTGGGVTNETPIVWEDGTTTGISNVKTNVDKAAIYNMNGQRVHVAKKGLYIINGRKVVVK